MSLLKRTSFCYCLLLALPLAAGTVRIIQTNSAGDNVHIIDPATNKVVGVIEGIEVNHGAAIAPDGSRIYVSNEADSTLDFVDARTLKVTKKVKLSGHPNNIAVARDGGHARQQDARRLQPVEQLPLLVLPAGPEADRRRGARRQGRGVGDADAGRQDRLRREPGDQRRLGDRRPDDEGSDADPGRLRAEAEYDGSAPVIGSTTQRMLILFVAYNAEKNIADVLARVPAELSRACDVEVLVLDDSSADATFDISTAIQRSGRIPFPVHVLYKPVNQGYGGNQKIGYHFAIKHRFDYVALLHGDGQYAPEVLPNLLQPILGGGVAAVFGSRMLTKGEARVGGMPLYKRVGNRVLSTFQNAVLRTALSEFHSGYRVYSVEALKKIPFDSNTNDFHFDTEIIVQLLLWKMRIVEVPIPTYYGDEICRVNGIKYAADVVRTVLVARAQRLGLLYDRKFDADRAERYESKVDFPSPHRTAIDLVRRGARVLDLGCGPGYVSAALRAAKGGTGTGGGRA